LSGQTKIATGTGLKYVTHPTFTGDTQIVDKKYVDDSIVTATGSTVYTLQSPAAVAVGGITVGWVLTGKTSNCILQDILVPELYGTVSAPSNSIALNPSTTTYEVGSSISTIFTGSFATGNISPQYCSTSSCRSGLPNNYCFTGSQIAGLYPSTALSKAKSLTGYTVTSGAQTWGVCVYYDAGVQPKGSKGTNFCSPLAAGNTANAPATITGIYPYYYGQLTSGSRPAVTNALITGGTKCQLNAGTCTSVIFSAVGQWTWFALPDTCAARAFWCETALSRGCMASAPSDKYPDTCNISISSGQACWAGISYNVYMSGTVGNVGTIALSSYLIP
jgi:hypothetical protein